MASELNNIPQIICSLFPQYYIYNFQYTFTPQEGVRMKIYFVSKDGKYISPILSVQQYVNVAIVTQGINFNVYATKYGFEYKYGRRVMWVEFVDDVFKLENYYIALTGTACGFRIYQLGTNVDNRSVTQQLAQAIDPISQQIRNFTQFPDYEYGFQDFLNILQQKFSLAPTLPSFDPTFKKSFIGTFKTVLNEWCKFYNLSWYYENGKLYIIDPTNLIMNFNPGTVPTDVLEYEYSESLEETFGKTVSMWYQIQGNQLTINGAGENILVTATMYPLGQNLNGIQSIANEIQNSVQSTLGNIANIVNPQTTNITTAQTIPDPNQVAAALYGEKFWFLYNYYNGTASTECGWTPIPISSSQATVILGTNVGKSLNAINLQVATLDKDFFDQKYQAYSQYAQKIAGKYYVSNQVSNIDDMKTYNWYNITNGQIFDFTSAFADSLKITMEYALSQNGTIQAIPDTNINQFFDGIKYIGNVMYYKDTTFPDTSQYTLDDVTSSAVNAYYDLLMGQEGTNSLDFSELTQPQGLQKYLAYQDVIGYPNVSNSSIQGYINNLSTVATALQPTFSTFNVIGAKTDDINNMKIVGKLPSTINIVDNVSTNIAGNTSVLRVPKDGGYVLYYDKIANCISAYSDGNYFQHLFETKPISSDTPIPLSLQISPDGTQYVLNRDLTQLNVQMSQQLLIALSAPRTFNTIEVSYTFNYLPNGIFGITPITKGLVGIDWEQGDEGMTLTCKFSNAILKVPNSSESFLQKLELQLKNSWIRNYNPQNVVT